MSSPQKLSAKSAAVCQAGRTAADSSDAKPAMTWRDQRDGQPARHLFGRAAHLFVTASRRGPQLGMSDGSG